MQTLKNSIWTGLLLGTAPLWACNSSHVLGAGGSGAVYTMSADTMEEGGFYMGVNAESTNNTPLSDAEIEKAIANGSEHIHSIDSINTYSVSMSYGVTDLLTLNVLLPYVSRKNIRAGEHHVYVDDHGHGETVHLHGDSEGIGDLSAILQYKIYDADKTKMSVLAGIKTPTGKTDVYDGNELLESDLQPGSGSWDFFAGAAVSKDFEDFSLLSNILYKYNTEGKSGYQLGNVFSYNFAFAYKLLGDEHEHHVGEEHADEAFDYSVDFFIEFNGQYVQGDTNFGFDVENTGNHVLFATTGFQFISNKDYSAYIAIGVPIYEDYTGVQSEMKYKATLGIGKSF
jgi:hypothetical protein